MTRTKLFAIRNTSLSVLQAILIGFIPPLAAHCWFQPVAFVPTAFQIIFELHGIVLKLSDVPFIALLLVTVVRAVRDLPYRQHLFQTAQQLFSLRTNQAWLVLIGLMWLSLCWSPAPSLAVFQAFYTLLMLIMLTVMMASAPQYRLWWISMFVFSAALQGVLAVMQGISGGAIGLSILGEPSVTSNRAFGLTYNPNTLADFLLIAAALALFTLTQFQQRTTRIGLWVAFGCIAAGLFATRSRAAVAILVLVSASWCFRGLWIGKHLPHRLTIMTTLLLTLVGGFAAYSALGRNFDAAEIRTRLTFAYAGSWSAYQESPLLGVGAGQIMLHVDRFVSAGILPYYDLQSDGLLQPAHNAYLNVLAELGPVGLLLFLSGLVQPFRGLFRLTSANWGISLCILSAAGIMLFEFQFWLDPHWRMVLLWLVGLWWSYQLMPQVKT